MFVEVSMNNKNGFTLIELIATIVLITLSSTIIVINLQGSSSKEDKSLSEKNDQKITDAACNAIDSLNANNIIGKTRSECKNATNGCNVTLEMLIKSGLIDAYTSYDETGQKIDNLNKTAIYVNIKWVKEGNYYKKTCTLSKP